MHMQGEVIPFSWFINGSDHSTSSNEIVILVTPYSKTGLKMVITNIIQYSMYIYIYIYIYVYCLGYD